MRFILLLFVVANLQSFAQINQPILRIETGMHLGQGKRIDADASGKLILTSSVDKTARLWDAATGTLLHTFRVPIAQGDEGILYACALSRDGSIAALAGITGREWTNAYCVYIVNTSSGEIINRISGFPSNIMDLTFSPDGKYLAVGTSLNNGVFIYDTKDWNKFKSLQGYKTEVYNIAFSKSGKMATACWDGKLRLYDKNFELITTVSSIAGKQPMGLSFSYDETLIGVGYYDTTTIEIRSGTDLKLLYNPIVKNDDFDGVLCNVSFSLDDNSFYAGGTSNTTDKDGYLHTVIRKWNNNGKGEWKDISFRNTIQDIKPLPGGKLAVLGGFPEVAVIKADGEKAWEQVATLNDFTGPSESHFRINEDGNVIGCTPLYTGAMTFDVGNRRLSASSSNFPSPADKRNGTVVTNWNQMPDVAINGKQVDFFETHETNLSADIGSDGKTVILGTEWNLYKADNNGKMIWKTPLPDFAWLVNISGNDKVVAAAIADGTIHWYSMEDGKELLTLYFSNDYKKWILFTPSGYYDASPGAEDVLGWHINNGKDKTPSFFPISRFREQFFRPDIIDQVLQVYNEDIAIANANKKSSTHPSPTNLPLKLPPTVSITYPANNISVTGEMLEIQYSINTADESPVTSIKVLVNGRPVATERGVSIKSSKEKNKIKVNIPHEDCTITILAENEHGLSPEANLHVSYKANTAATPVKGNAYLLVIGISNYLEASLKLDLAAKDAGDFSESIHHQQGITYNNVEVKPLYNQDATKANILDAFDWLANKTYGKDDVVMIYFAGHGANDNNNIYYMLPYEANIEKMRSSCVNFEELKQTIAGIKAKVLVFLDACHSGNAAGNGISINGLVNMLSGSGTGAVTFTSSTGKEVSYERREWNNGAFTKALVEGLSGKAAVAGKNKITYKSLDLYISERVAELTDNKQHPTTVPAPNLPDFTIIAL